MARIARVVVPDLPHHVTQRGNRREPVFFEEGDYALYLDLLVDAALAVVKVAALRSQVGLLLGVGRAADLQLNHRREPRSIVVEALLPAPIYDGPIRANWFFRPSANIQTALAQTAVLLREAKRRLPDYAKHFYFITIANGNPLHFPAGQSIGAPIQQMRDP